MSIMVFIPLLIQGESGYKLPTRAPTFPVRSQFMESLPDREPTELPSTPVPVHSHANRFSEEAVNGPKP